MKIIEQLSLFYGDKNGENSVWVKEFNIIFLKKVDKICLYQFLYNLNILFFEYVCFIKIIVFLLFFINFKRYIIIY